MASNPGWLVALMVGCSWPGPRIQEMADHEADLYRARDAVLADDLGALHAAARELGEPDRVPGLVPPTEHYLAGLRATATSMEAVESVDAAAAHVVEMTIHCAQCHDALGIRAVTPLPDTKANRWWIGLVFVDEASWTSGVAGEPELAAARSWSERRAAAVRWLERQ